MYEQLTITEIFERRKRGELDLIAWNQQFIARSKQDTIKAWAYLDEKRWLANLEQALATNKNEAYTELLGVPVGIKDTFNTADMPTQMGSPLWAGFTPGNDARVVHNIKYHGGLTAGKTVTAEFAVHAPNETRNPWNPDYSPGTSSSGSAAAVAAGMVPLSLGTQTAGSIVRPASYCGVFGFKPTFGTIPRTGTLKTTDTLDSIGLFGTNIDDCRRLFDVMRVKGLDYPYVHNRLENHAFQQVNGAKWKVGIVTDQHAVFNNYSDYAVDAFADFVAQLQSDPEIELVHPSFGPLFGEAHAFQRTIYHKSLSYYFKKEFENQTLISPVMYEIISEGNTITPAEYQTALQQQNQLSAEINALFDDLDIIITLSTAGHAPAFGVAIDPPDTSLIWTLCGLPVVNVPQFHHNGLPFGFQAMTKKYGDYKLLSFLERLAHRGLTPAFAPLSTV